MSCLLKYEKYNRLSDKIEELGSEMFETGRNFWVCKKEIRNRSGISLEGITGKCSINILRIKRNIMNLEERINKNYDLMTANDKEMIQTILG